MLGNAVTHFFWRTRFPLYFNILMPALSFNPNYDGITVLKQNDTRTIILAKILCYAPRAVA